MQVLQLVMVVMAGFVISGTDAALCDTKITDAIKENWKKGGGAPKDVLKQIVAAGKTVVVRATSAIASDDTRCMYTTMVQSAKKPGVDLHYSVVLKNGHESSGTVYVEEEDGVLVSDIGGGVKLYRYLLEEKLELFSMYQCESKGAKGVPEAYIGGALTSAATQKDTINEMVKNVDTKYKIKLDKELHLHCSVKNKKD